MKPLEKILEAVIQLDEAYPCLKLKKKRIVAKELESLDFMVNQSRMTPSNTKGSAITDGLKPMNLKDLRSVLNVVNPLVQCRLNLPQSRINFCPLLKLSNT